MSLLEELKRVHNKMQNPENWEANGFCILIPHNDAHKCKLYAMFTEWPRFSGNLCFPVTTSGDPRCDYMHQWENDEFWDRENSEYAALRWELLEFCIAQLGTANERKGVESASGNTFHATP